MINIASSTHIPVMPEEVLSLMEINPSGNYIDGTCGLGGHSKTILSKLSNNGFLLGLDIDNEAIKICKKNLSVVNSNFHIEKRSYSKFPEVLGELGIERVDGILLDLGLSSMQLSSNNRGFSFQNNDTVDMRFDRSTGETAKALIKRLTEEQLAKIEKVLPLGWAFGDRYSVSQWIGPEKYS